ncbi:unnamed protein product [Cladocopium goreaui]|uniref:Uncharacterized protein n=1 Tax=Cladocopium goreaui TaxID=2562237 RepID=A0A9P1D0B0_9DINO|nr:unnamed protein product [Cladocopium goreaui]
MSQIPAEVVKEVDTILANEALSVLQKVEKLFKTFSGSGFGYKQHVLPKDTLTHPSNRGGSMLNAADVWEKGHRMVKVGVQPSLLNEGAVAFELATEEGMRKRQLDANVALVKASGDTLAPVTFQERFLTVATSHTAAFCKAVEQGLKGPLGFPVDPKQDPGLQQLCSKGWPFLVLSNAVEVKWPQLPSYIQSALNAVNNSYQQMTEIEAASQMCEYLNHGMALKEALQKVQECDPACKRSLEAIAWFVSRYGGERQCLVKFLAHFSKTYGSLLLGEEMMKSIAYMEFKGSTSLYPFLRTALWASMMCSNRSSDGYSKLLNKSDCEKLKNAAFKAQVDMAEQALADGWEVIQKSTAEQATKLAAFGRLCTRLTLHVLKKEKHGREPAGHESINAICTLFAADLAGGAKPSVRKEEAKPTVELEVKNVLASTPAELALLQNPHMKQGQLYTCSKEHGNKIWTFLNSSASKVKFSHQPVFGPAESVEVEFEKLKDVAFSNHPNLVWSVKKVKKGALKLFPAGTVTKVKDTPVGGKHYIKAFGHHWLVQPFKALTDFKKGEGVLAPFWWVKSADNEGNMQLAEATVDGCKIPYLVNCTPLGPEEMLVLEKPENASSAKKQSKVKNPSLSSSVHLQKMLEDRNTAAMTFLNAQGQAAEPKENLFEESEEVEDKQPASKKRKCADAGDFTVEIQVQEQPVQVLLRGARPTRSDLLVRMEPDQLKAVLQLLEEEAADCLAADRRQYKKAKQCTALNLLVKKEKDDDDKTQPPSPVMEDIEEEPLEVEQKSLLDLVASLPENTIEEKMDVDSLGKLLVEEIEKYKKAMGIAVKEEKDEDAVKDKTDKEITEMKKEPMEKRKLPMPTWQSKKPKNDDPKDSLAPPPPPPTTTRRTDVGHRSGKTYGSLLLGEEMMKPIAYMEFKGSTSLYPFLRWASMMCSNRSSDGYSKLLNKSDCEKLKNAAFKAQVDMAEQALADGWEVIQKSTAEQATKLAAFGRLCTRLTLHVLKKEKHGREPAGHESISAICTLFAADLAGGAKPSVRKEEAKPTVELEVKNVLASTPAELALLQNPHVKQGQLYTCSKEHGNKIWTFLDSSASKVKFSHQPVFGPAESIEVEFEKLKDVAFSNRPNLVWSVKKVKKGALKLFPAGTVTKVKDTPVGGKHYIKAFGHHWLVQPFKALTDFKKGEGVLAPFWWVKSADNEGNMQLAEATVDGCKIPYLVNCTPLGPEEMLVLEKPENASSAKKQKLKA